jgi:hypothetical protein
MAGAEESAILLLPPSSRIHQQRSSGWMSPRDLAAGAASIVRP